MRVALVAILIAIVPASARAQLDAAQKTQVAGWLEQGAIDALAGHKAKAMANFDRAAVRAQHVPGVQEAVGTAALLLGDLNQARRVLARIPAMAAFRAMALSHGPGGLARAQTELAAHAKLPDDQVEPTALFLSALAFADAKQPKRADEILQRALTKADSALDGAFAPDPAVAMVRSVLRAIEVLGDVNRARAKLAMALHAANRRGEAARLAEAALDDPSTRTAALRVLVLLENATHTRRALKRVRRLLAEEPDAADAQVAQVVLLMRTGQKERAKTVITTVPPVDDDELRSELDRVRARLAIEAKQVEDALEASKAALRANPKSNASLALHIEALLLANKTERAEAFAGQLLKRKPIDEDPYVWLERIELAKRNKRKAKDMKLRSMGFKSELAKLEHVVKVREDVLRGVRDAESSDIGAAGLEALRGEYATLSLPIDLALARQGTRGFARAARDRILAACAPHLVPMLRRTKGWAWTEVSVAPYGKALVVEAPLTAADPSRCRAARIRRKR